MLSSSSSLIPNEVQNALCVAISSMTFKIVCVALPIDAKVVDLAARRLVQMVESRSSERMITQDVPVCSSVVLKIVVILAEGGVSQASADLMGINAKRT